MMEDTKEVRQYWLVYRMIVATLVLRALAGLFLRGGEWPPSPTHFFLMTLDAALLVSLVMLSTKLGKEFSAEDPRRRTEALLFWPGLLAGIALLGIRFTSTAAWHTGHLTSQFG